MLGDAHAKFPASLRSLGTKLTAIPPGSPRIRILLDVGYFLCWGIDALRSQRHYVPRDLSCLRIPPGSPRIRVLLDVGSFLCWGIDALRSQRRCMC